MILSEMRLVIIAAFFWFAACRSAGVICVVTSPLWFSLVLAAGLTDEQKGFTQKKPSPFSVP